MKSINDLSPAQLTLMKGGTEGPAQPGSVVEFILRNGWAAATTRQYAAAVNRYLTFITTLKDDSHIIPASDQRIYHFILWCSTSSSRNVSSNTISRYLTGIRMWHTLHGHPFPTVDPHRTRLLLKACRKTETITKHPSRVGLSLQDVVGLTDKLTTGNDIDLVTKAIILIGFWSLARLGELTLHPDHPLVFIRRGDVSFSEDGKSAKIRLRQAKTALHGELQFLRVNSQPNRLDPVNILHEVLLKIPGVPSNPLFPGRVRSIPMTKGHIVKFLRGNGPQDASVWGGHSLRIGGASFQFEAGRPIASLKRLGRWRSESYKLYVRRYSPLLKKRTKALATLLHF